jgi:AraC-like DNA-binding protein
MLEEHSHLEVMFATLPFYRVFKKLTGVTPKQFMARGEQPASRSEAA